MLQKGMLQSLHLRNFQCHEKLDLELDSINTIIGATNKGKSAVIRALRWLVHNQPAGGEFIRDGAKFTRVRLVVDGHTITRKLGRTNEYRLDTQRYVAFGRGVPAPIGTLLNATSDNFQLQLAGPFWFELTPGQVAKELNRIINLGVIDGTLAAVAAEARKAKATVEVTRERLTEAKAARARLTFVPGLAGRFKGLQDKQAEIGCLTQQVSVIRGCVEQATTLATAVKNAATGLVVAHRALQAGEAWVTAKAAVEELKGLVGTVESQETKLTCVQQQLSKARARLATQRACPLCGSPLSPS